MNADRIHTVIAMTAIGLLAAGAWQAWGIGYAALVTGAVLLSSVIYARTR